MMYNDTIIGETREELVQYTDRQWEHIILHTILNKNTFGLYIYTLTSCSTIYVYY